MLSRKGGILALDIRNAPSHTLALYLLCAFPISIRALITDGHGVHVHPPILFHQARIRDALLLSKFCQSMLGPSSGPRRAHNRPPPLAERLSEFLFRYDLSQCVHPLGIGSMLLKQLVEPRFMLKRQKRPYRPRPLQPPQHVGPHTLRSGPGDGGRPLRNTCPQTSNATRQGFCQCTLPQYPVHRICQVHSGLRARECLGHFLPLLRILTAGRFPRPRGFRHGGRLELVRDRHAPRFGEGVAHQGPINRRPLSHLAIPLFLGLICSRNSLVR